MNNLVQVTYDQTGQSAVHNDMGMREMQARAFKERNRQYLLIKAPPACGKSRALMFLALDKLHHQNLRKAIVAVPEMSIGSSFRDTRLTDHGFFADWQVAPTNNLCFHGMEEGKVAAFTRFMESDDKVLVCTHATLRNAFNKLDVSVFNDCLVAIDEFHHVSVDEDNRLGALIDGLMQQSSTHLIAMTGSYFRGDTNPILTADDEALFTKVTYTYYEQLNGYEHLKTLSIGYHFYQGRYMSALPLVLDTDLKTIIYIPNVNSSESDGDKYTSVDAILDIFGIVESCDQDTGIYTVRRKSDGKRLKVANLVDDMGNERPKVQTYLRNIASADDMDIIIALGMAKEGFDWPYCEHVLTIGYRSSLTEIVQIIGRATRDCPGKTHAQFTNLIAQPDAQDSDVKVSVNNMLKAITTSLLMEQILAPSIQFKPRAEWNGKKLPSNTVLIGDGTEKVSDKVLNILNSGKEEIMVALMAKDKVVKEAITKTSPIECINKVELPKVILELHPDLSDYEMKQVQSGILQCKFIQINGGIINEADLPKDADIEDDHDPKLDEHPDPLKEKKTIKLDNDDPKPSKQFLKIGNKFINIDNLNIDLIASVNPFHGAYEILSKQVDAPMLKTIQEVVSANRSQIDEEEAVALWPRINAFCKEYGRHPSLQSSDPSEVRMAEAVAFIRRQRQQRMAQQGSTT
ncbi:DEAD/DEAH box helicase [Aeromonas hydrophila]|uniref:DEAD/DEAH box helicase n=1 Tax=Aeromonas hydrophila TaxID=644 RepID=UPI00398854E7